MEILGGICVDGPAVICDESNDTVDMKLNRIERLLGIMPDEDSIDKAGSHIKVKWLQHHFTNLPHNPTPTIITRFARATIMLLLSSQFLSDKRGAQAPTWKLNFLKDLDLCRQYSWGSSILSYLYSNLCKAALRKTKGVAGPLILLQFWAWSRFTTIQPCDSMPNEPVALEGLPRLSPGGRWASLYGPRRPHVVGHNI